MRLFIALVCLFVLPGESFAAAVRLGESMNNPHVRNRSGVAEKKIAEISCFENSECKPAEECVALRCVNVCTRDTCYEGKYCAPGKEPHTHRCADCVIDAHCSKGEVCRTDYTCGKPDPCRNAVCSPAAPFCMPKPYQTLPYTCVQCQNNSHCPPVGGLSRKCVDGFCLFNIEGNIPNAAPQKKPEVKKAPPPAVQNVKQQQEIEEYDDDYYEEEEYYGNDPNYR